MEQNERILVDEFDNLQKIKKEIDIKIEKEVLDLVKKEKSFRVSLIDRGI